MQEHETIVDRAEKWRDNIPVFLDKHEFKTNKEKETVRIGLKGLIKIAVEQSQCEWSMADEICPNCGGETIWDERITVLTTRHKNGEVEHCDGRGKSTGLAYECCDCNEILMTSPTALVCPPLPGDENQERASTDTTLTTRRHKRRMVKK